MSATSLTATKHYDRLPRNVIPSLYKLELQPDLEKFTFNGKEEIEVSVKEKTNQVIVNVAEIEISDASFKYSSGDVLKGKVIIDEVNEKAFIKFNEELVPGNGVLSLTFTGILNDKMKGFYRSKYKTPEGEERYSATTKFEAPYARRAFPCWDEPSFKAKFEVTIIAPKDRTVLSNTDPVKDVPHPENPNLKIVQFAPSPVMSTYLVAFVIGEYDYVETRTKRDTRIRVYTPLNKKDQGEFALEVASKSLTFFEDFFNIPFPLGKLDHIGVADLCYGAMENWGVITYRELRIFADHKNTSASSKEGIALTVTHETAHQWFGNLVTMEWWTDLWLNEGFATFMSYLSTDSLFAQFEVWSQFVTSVSIPAFYIDSYHASHPIEIPVNHPDDIDSIFDQISYEKGASIIKMCYDWIGDEAFRKGLNQYLSKHAYGNAVTQDLWDSLEAASNKPVGKTMAAWTKQLGYPVIRVECRQEGMNRILKLSQSKFSIDGTLTDEEKGMIWMIPISVVTSKDANSVAVSTLMTTKEMELIVPNVSVNDWIKLNPKVTGFYRIDYSSEMLNSLNSGISSKQFGPVDRLQIINDTFASVMSGRVPTRLVLSLLDAYVDEDNYVTWVAIDNCFGKLGLLLSYTDLSDKLSKLGIELYSKVFERLGFDSKEGESHTDSLLRALVLNRLAKFKYDPVLKESHKRFKDHLAGKLIHPNIRDCVYQAVASSCDEDTFASFFKLYRKSDSSEEKVRLLVSIGASLVPYKIHQVHKFAISNEVRAQDAWMGVVATTGSRVGCQEAWKFFKENAEEFRERYGSHRANANLISACISGFATEEAVKEVEQFFVSSPFSGHEKVILRGLDSIRLHSNWLKREVDGVRNFFTSKYPN